ncbi:arylamine N-acetyltransferase, liver isozyme-like [Pipra filicauda]|uniref:arylamine N-acetyltransferase n=1 Tax=Pipra filicauda TaxID=649802 RepID=A0A6J2H013_9PASS|nr:arylamine N-acetyltransferase, liver isozyme-like [Pipra filicauda]XP_039236744.1 arylamine N-acetyltransferase, liver isozyme-like [Pipra filicauda]XP_039236745.1 arylamine N-acetyltransferase, liver isozyme-like [Pipra filicauda]
MNIQEYFGRISYNKPHKDADLQTLKAVFQHHIQAIPFENLSMHCGETIELDLQSIYNKIVRKKRGGWCLETNYLLYWALQELGYDVCILGANSYDPAQRAYTAEMNHILLKVVIQGNSYIVDAGFGGAYQMWQPLRLISGKDQPQVPGIFRFVEDNGTWYFEKVKRKHYIPEQSETPYFTDTPGLGNIRKIHRFTLEPRHINDFQELNTYLQVSPDNILRKKSLCSLQTTEGLIGLVGWTLTEMKYNYTEDMDLVHITTLTDEELEKTLKDKFNIVLENKLVPVNVRGLPPNLVDKI